MSSLNNRPQGRGQPLRKILVIDIFILDKIKNKDYINNYIEINDISCYNIGINYNPTQTGLSKTHEWIMKGGECWVWGRRFGIE